MTTEAEGVRKSYVNCALLSLAKSEVEVVVDLFVAVVVFVVDSWRNDVFLYRLHTEHRFHSTGSTEHVTSHRLGGADVEFVSVLTEEVNDSLCFAEVAHRGRSSVHVDEGRMCVLQETNPRVKKELLSVL